MAELLNTPSVKMGLVAVSRDCFPAELARKRMNAVIEACKKARIDITPCELIIETERDALAATDELTKKGANVAAIFLGNFGPEGPTTIFAKTFGKPFMLCGAAEETTADLIDGRGDAFCGMLNAAYNCGLRGLRPYIPPRPIGLAEDIADMIGHFADVARALMGLRNLKVFAFGPRPQDFYACNAPIQPLYDLDVEVMENSELDLLELYKSVADRRQEIEAVAEDMA